MKRYFLKKDSRQDLTVIFGGWGSWPGLFAECPFSEEKDVLLCYDYRSFESDWSVLENYRRIDVVAWSMGVKVASVMLGGFRHGGAEDGAGPYLGHCVAVNGTMYPIDDARGIPTAVFDATLERMSGPVLEKFLRRMCGKDLAYYKSRGLDRTPEELKSELEALKKFALEHDTEGLDFKWDLAVIGKNDLIFPAAGQLRAWEGTAVKEVECAHYCRELFEDLLK